MMEAILLSLLSGLVATIITLICTHINQKRIDKFNYKMKIFQELIAYRSDMTSAADTTGNFQKAINQVFVAYNDCPNVLKAFEQFRKSVTMEFNRTDEYNSQVIDNLLSLLKAMAKEVKIDCSFSNDSLFTIPIIIKKNTNK